MKIKKFKTVEDMVINTFGKKEGKKVIEGMNRHREYTEIAHSLETLRNDHGLTNKELAKKMKVSVDVVNCIENSCDYDLTINQIKQYLKALGYKLEISFVTNDNDKVIRNMM